MVVAGVAAPLVRKRVNLHPVAVQSVAYAAPLGLSVARPRTRGRDVAVCALQMWAYVAAYKTPHDDEAAQAARVHIRYPIVVDRDTRARRAADGAPAARALAQRRRRARVALRSTACSCGRTGRGSWSRTARRLHARAPPAALPARGGDHLRGVRHRRQLLLDRAHGAAVVCGWSRRAHGGRSRGRAANDGRVRRAFLAGRLGLALQCVRRQPLAAMPSLHFATICHGCAPARRGGTGGRCARLGVRGDARLRAGVSGRALRRGPDRGRGARPLPCAG